MLPEKAGGGTESSSVPDLIQHCVSMMVIDVIGLVVWLITKINTVQTSSHLTACFLEYEMEALALLGTFGNLGLQSFHGLYTRFSDSHIIAVSCRQATHGCLEAV